MRYLFTEEGIKTLSSLPKLVQRRILHKLKFFMSSPNPLYFAEHLNNFSLGKYRFQIGNYRVSFDVENDTAKILKVDHRRDIFK